MLEGGCLCGAVRFESTGQVLHQALCHCLDCRKITGSTHSTNFIAPNDGFAVTKGTPKEFRNVADSGKTVTLFFCGDCGSTLWSESSIVADSKTIKVGTLDSDNSPMEDAKPQLEIFVRNRPSWMAAVTDAAQHEAAPAV